MRAHTITTKVALLLSLLALGALGLVACGGGDDDETTAAPATANRLSEEEEITKVGNEWAPLFAEDARRAACNRYMGQSACNQMFCAHVAPGPWPIGNCTPPSSGFQKSFANATVGRVVVEDDKPGPAGCWRHAAAEFSNGELVEFWPVKDLPEQWNIATFVADACKKYFEP
jgi:hypothetical protein